MPTYFVVPYPYPLDAMNYWRFKDGYVQAVSAEEAARIKKIPGRVQVLNLDDAEIFSVETRCTTTVEKQ